MVVCFDNMGNIKFNENTRVQVPAALHLCKLGYTYLDDILAYDTKTNILVDVFLNAVKRLNPELTSSEVSLLFSKVVNIANNDDLGREFYQLLSSNSGVKLIDFDNPDNNDWHVTTEFTCENKDTEDNFRPDITCFVNGLPLAFIEVKKPNNHDGILAERDRINKRMSKSCFRRFFNITPTIRSTIATVVFQFKVLSILVRQRTKPSSTYFVRKTRISLPIITLRRLMTRQSLRC